MKKKNLVWKEEVRNGNSLLLAVYTDFSPLEFGKI